MRQMALAAVAVFGLASFAAAGDIDGQVVGRSDRPFYPPHAAVVWLEGIASKPAGSAELVMAQRGGQFVPNFLVVVSGQTVSMPNQDDIAHNVYSLSAAKQFNLGFYAKGDRKTVTFERPGLVEVDCVIHSFMRGKILVVPNKYYATVATDGSFHIRNVPAGTFTLTFWADGLAQFSQPVTVSEHGKSPVVRVALPNAP
jgi:plastocyanin